MRIYLVDPEDYWKRYALMEAEHHDVLQPYTRQFRAPEAGILFQLRDGDNENLPSDGAGA